VRLIYDATELSGVTIVKPRVTEMLQMISELTPTVSRAHESVEKDTIRDVGTYVWRISSLGGTRYGTYAANWTYCTHISILNIQMWSKWNVLDLGLTDEDVCLLSSVDCDISRLNRINKIIILSRYTFFSENSTIKNFRVKRAWPRAISRWVTDQKVFPSARTSEDKSAQKRLVLICGASLWS
jgi:hypothetical protein